MFMIKKMYVLSLVIFLLPLFVYANQANTRLMDAIKGNKETAIKLLLDVGADPNAKVGNETPLIMAVKNGNSSIVKMLINKGADANKVNSKKESAMQIAFENLKKAYDAIPTKKEKRSVKLKNIKRYNDIIYKLLSVKAKPNVKTKTDLTPLIIAGYKKDLKMVKGLIKAGAEINYQNSKGRTALMYACSASHLVKKDKRSIIQIVKYLIKSGANVELKSKTGATALLITASNGITPAFKLIKKTIAENQKKKVALAKEEKKSAENKKKADTLTKKKTEKKIDMIKKKSGSETKKAIVTKKKVATPKKKTKGK